MLLNKLTPALRVDDIKATIAYYEEMLGFDLELTVPSTTKIEWALMRCGEIEIMFQAKTGSGEAEKNDFRRSVTLHFEGEGVKDLYEYLKNRVQIVRHLYPTFYGTNEFSMVDCNGCMLVFAEKVKKEENEE
jgi:lactoylglutathione lyase